MLLRFWERIPAINILFLVHPPFLWNSLIYQCYAPPSFLVSEEEKLAYFLLPIGHPVYPILVLPPPPTHSEEGGLGKELGVGNVTLATETWPQYTTG